jgi:hypothetical protein
MFLQSSAIAMQLLVGRREDDLEYDRQGDLISYRS